MDGNVILACERGVEGRKERVDEFFRDVKRLGLTEIRERRTLAVSKMLINESRYVNMTDGYNVYYIMR